MSLEVSKHDDMQSMCKLFLGRGDSHEVQYAVKRVVTMSFQSHSSASWDLGPVLAMASPLHQTCVKDLQHNGSHDCFLSADGMDQQLSTRRASAC